MSGDQNQKLHELENTHTPTEARVIRMKFIEEKLQKQFPSIDNTKLNAESLYKRNIENFIGGVELPVGIAGPVKINGDYANGEYYVPLATTEGTLVASTNRGATVTNLSGGITVTSEYIGVTRAPLLRTTGIAKTREVITWVKQNFDKLAEIAHAKDPFLTLIKIDPFSHGKNLWLRMFYNADEAMGMNMVSQASNDLAIEISNQMEGVELLTVSGNMCTDKKPTALNIIEGRGRRVRAEAVIKKEIVEKYFRTTAKRIESVNREKVWEGTAMSGGFSYNAHFANIVAAAFCATGQDLAHVVDSSLGYCTMEDQDGDLYVSITLSCLMMGSIGGGTRLPAQFEAQKLMLTEINSQKEPEKNRTNTMAEIITSAVLCGELSLHAALTASEHVKAHNNFGRSSNENK